MGIVLVKRKFVKLFKASIVWQVVREKWKLVDHSTQESTVRNVSVIKFITTRTKNWKFTVLFMFVQGMHILVWSSGLPVLENYGIWDQLRIEGGSEFTLISKIQEFYKEFRNDKTRVPVHATKSVNVSD